jgi:hypothetical protein
LGKVARFGVMPAGLGGIVRSPDIKKVYLVIGKRNDFL